jgi:catechol 2,3-dioxygenase-like lactoylglutathione lyase family enzyme
VKVRLDHVGLDVTDYERSKAFYLRALDPLGLRLMMEPVPEVGGFGDDFPFFWVARRDHGPQTGVHVAFRVGSRDLVDAFHAAALAAGGTERRRSSSGGRSRGCPVPRCSCSTPTATTSRS